MKKKLLILHPTIAPYRIDYFNALNETFDMKLVLWNNGIISQKFEMEKLYAQLNFMPELKTERHGFWLLKLRKGLFSAMKNFKPDTIMSCECGPETIMALLYKLLIDWKCRVVTMIDDSYDMILGQQIKKRHAIAERIVLPMLNDVICVEPRVTNWMQSRFGKGVTMPIISKESSTAVKYQHIMPISEKLIKQFNLIGKKVVLFVGRLDPEKNIDSLIKAFIKISQVNSVLVIVGSGSKEEELKKTTTGTNNIIFTGRLEGDEVYAWYNIANIFILPSLLEPFGAVTAEALSGGCYCLVSNKAGSQCLIQDHVNGRLIEPSNIDDISFKIMEALDEAQEVELPLKRRQSLVTDSFEMAITKLYEHI